MKFTFIMHAPKDSVFAADAFDSQVGTDVAFRAQSGRPTYAGVLHAAEVMEEGTAVKITMDLPDDAVIDLRDTAGGYSIGPNL